MSTTHFHPFLLRGVESVSRLFCKSDCLVSFTKKPILGALWFISQSRYPDLFLVLYCLIIVTFTVSLDVK